MLKAKYRKRSSKGQAMMVLISILAFILFPALFIITFETVRLILAQQQLKNATDAAALATVATLASQDNTDPTTAHQNSEIAALKVFKQNVVLGLTLTNTTVDSGPPAAALGAGEASIYFEFLDPNTLTVLPISSPNAKIVRVHSTLGCSLAFKNYTSMVANMRDFNISAQSEGAVPVLDLVLCMDVSGSIDDQTPVTLVERQWDRTTNKLIYELPSGTCTVPSGTIYDVVQPPPTGTSVNGVAPQCLGSAYSNGGAYFSEFLGAYLGTPGMRSLHGYPDAGEPPGNYTPGGGTAVDYNATFHYGEFTDMVVNIDGNPTFGGCVSNGYSFPSYAVLVEASRGNLESTGVFNSSKASSGLSGITPRAGYQQAYLTAAQQLLQPINAAKNAALTFTDIINTNTNAHFGFEAFSDGIGSTTTQTVSGFYTIDTNNGYAPSSYLGYGVAQDFPMPYVQTDPTQTNYTAVNQAINSCVALGGTNIGAAIDGAVKLLSSSSHTRTGSFKAIVLFTDGEPSATPSFPGPLDSDPDLNARKAAQEASDAGIPVYTIGLAQNSAIVPGETAILNDTNPDPSTGGIAAIAGHGGSFNLVTDSSNLRAAFEKIARHLVQLVASGESLTD
jgi:Flp pilus assembly protein TadG